MKKKVFATVLFLTVAFSLATPAFAKNHHKKHHHHHQHHAAAA
jgi:hypothetical protein